MEEAERHLPKGAQVTTVATSKSKLTLASEYANPGDLVVR
jgi:hypothetical protein